MILTGFVVRTMWQKIRSGNNSTPTMMAPSIMCSGLLEDCCDLPQENRRPRCCFKGDVEEPHLYSCWNEIQPIYEKISGTPQVKPNIFSKKATVSPQMLK